MRNRVCIFMKFAESFSTDIITSFIHYQVIISKQIILLNTYILESYYNYLLSAHLESSQNTNYHDKINLFCIVNIVINNDLYYTIELYPYYII